MKKKLTLIGLVALAISSSPISTIKAEEVKVENSNLNQLLNEYYNNGVYTRRTSIMFNDAALTESLEQYFIGNVILERTTYFQNETLLMGNINGTIGNGGINSGYTTIDGDMYHFVLDENSNTIDESTLRKDAKDTTVTEFFTTMKTFVERYTSDDSWHYENNTYKYYPTNISYNTSTKTYYDDALTDFLAFTASCFYNANELNYNYITLDHVEVEEVNSHLELRLYANKIECSKLSSTDNLLSVAKIYKGILPEDNQGDLLYIDGEYQHINGPISKVDTHLTTDIDFKVYHSDKQTYTTLDTSSVKTNGYYDYSIQLSNDDEYTFSSHLVYEDIKEREHKAVTLDFNREDRYQLNELKEYFKVLNPRNYTLFTQTYFNKDAVKTMNNIFDVNYYQNNVTKVNGDEFYVYNHTGDVNAYYTHNGVINVSNLIDGEITNTEVFTIKKNRDEYTTFSESISQLFFTFDNLTDSFVDKNGPTSTQLQTTIKYYYGWIKVDDAKYYCDRSDVITSFAKALCPGFVNLGMYMTYDHVILEILDDGTCKIELFASVTQSGKVIVDHFNMNKYPSWYLLISEAYVTDIGTTTII